MSGGGEDFAWKKLLEFSVDAASRQGNQEEHRPPDNEMPSRQDLEFLQKAMTATFCSPDVITKSVVAQFIELGEEKPDELIANFAQLAAAMELADKLDEYLNMGNFSEHFVAEKGLDALANLTMNAKNEDLQVTYLQLVPLLAENRPEFQEAIIGHKLFAQLISAVAGHQNVPIPVLSAVLASVSAIVRSHKPAWDKFCENGGIEAFWKVVTEIQDDKMAAKAAHILNNIHFTLEYSEYLPTAHILQLCDSIARSFINLKQRLAFLEAEASEANLATRKFVKERLEHIVTTLCMLKRNVVSSEVKRELREFLEKVDVDLKDSDNLNVSDNLGIQLPENE